MNSRDEITLSDVHEIFINEGKTGITSIESFTKGYGHDCWKVSADSNTYLLKINVRNSSADKFNNEVFSMRYASEHGMLVPNLYGTGKLAEHNKYYYIQEWLEGEDGQAYVTRIGDEDKEAFFYQFGETVARLHTLKGETFSEAILAGVPKSSIRELSLERLGRCVNSLKDSTAIEARLLLAVSNKLYERIERLASSIKPGFTHGDLHLGNVIVSGRSLYLIDFESSKFVDPAVDFFKLKLWSFQDNAEYFNTFQQGYYSFKKEEDDFQFRYLTYAGIEYLYCIDYFGNRYYDAAMLKQFITRLKVWNDEN